MEINKKIEEKQIKEIPSCLQPKKRAHSLGPSGVPCSWALRIVLRDGHLTTLLIFRRG